MIATSIATTEARVNTIREALEIMTQKDERVFEIRRVTPSPASWFFRDVTAAAEHLAALDANPEVEALYITLHPINPESLTKGTAASLDTKRQNPNSTRDEDIEAYTWVFIDCDPVRPAHTSSSEEEKRYGWETAKLILEYLRERGWPEPIIADSGNGYHLLFALHDLDPRSDAPTRLLRHLRAAFETEHVSVDTKVGNAARICKVYGTMTRKGENTAERPHRRSAIISHPKGVVDEVTHAQLEELVGKDSPREEALSWPFQAENSARLKPLLDLIPDAVGPKRGNDCEIWVFGCRTAEDGHADRRGRMGAASLIATSDGRIIYRCQGGRCEGMNLEDLLDAVDPDWRSKPRLSNLVLELMGSYDDDDYGEPEFAQTVGDRPELAKPPESKFGFLLPTADKIEMRPIEWLWPEHIPYRGLTIIGGDTEVGKSALSIDLAARITRGELPFAETCKPERVLLINGEDTAHEIITPRLFAAKAVMNMVQPVGRSFIDDKGNVARLSLPSRFRELKRMIALHRAKVVIIDPIDTYLDTMVDSHNNKAMRHDILSPLADLAEGLGLVFIVIMHPTKDVKNTNAKMRMNGSIAYVAAARSAFLIAPHPEDDIDTDDFRRVMARIKGNWGKHSATTAHSYILRSCTVPSTETGEPLSTFTVEWDSPDVSMTANDLLGGHNPARERKLAREFLTMHVSTAPRAASDLFKMAEEKNIASEATIRRIFKQMGGISSGGGKGRPAMWRFPSESEAAITAADQEIAKKTESVETGDVF